MNQRKLYSDIAQLANERPQTPVAVLDAGVATRPIFARRAVNKALRAKFRLVTVDAVLPEVYRLGRRFPDFVTPFRAPLDYAHREILSARDIYDLSPTDVCLKQAVTTLRRAGLTAVLVTDDDHLAALTGEAWDPVQFFAAAFGTGKCREILGTTPGPAFATTLGRCSA